MIQEGDKDHINAMNTMQELMRSPDEMKLWFEEKREAFNRLPEEL